MELGIYMDKTIKINFRDGSVRQGVATNYSSELDNPDGIASICMDNAEGLWEFYENEIASIEILPDVGNPQVLIVPDLQVAG